MSERIDFTSDESVVRGVHPELAVAGYSGKILGWDWKICRQTHEACISLDAAHRKVVEKYKNDYLNVAQYGECFSINTRPFYPDNVGAERVGLGNTEAEMWLDAANRLSEPVAASKEQCTGRFSDARDCPIHNPSLNKRASSLTNHERIELEELRGSMEQAEEEIHALKRTVNRLASGAAQGLLVHAKTAVAERSGGEEGAMCLDCDEFIGYHREHGSHREDTDPFTGEKIAALPSAGSAPEEMTDERRASVAQNGAISADEYIEAFGVQPWAQEAVRGAWVSFSKALLAKPSDAPGKVTWSAEWKHPDGVWRTDVQASGGAVGSATWYDEDRAREHFSGMPADARLVKITTTEEVIETRERKSE